MMRLHNWRRIDQAFTSLCTRSEGEELGNRRPVLACRIEVNQYYLTDLTVSAHQSSPGVVNREPGDIPHPFYGDVQRSSVDILKQECRRYTPSQRSVICSEMPLYPATYELHISLPSSCSQHSEAHPRTRHTPARTASSIFPQTPFQHVNIKPKRESLRRQPPRLRHKP